MENYAGNIIATLAGLPDFLRTPMLRRRLEEFFGMDGVGRREIVSDALDAGHTIPFPSLAKMFGTWLEVLAGMDEGRRDAIFSEYLEQAAARPERLVPYNLDGLLGVFWELDPAAQEAVSGSASRAMRGLGAEQRRRMLLVIPDGARKALGA